jgi:4-hydroxy-tetrahydrodipicolinate reductase
MKQGLRIAQYGCGKMSVYTMRYVFEKGAEVVAAFDTDPSVIGRDIGDIMGTSETGVVVQDAREADATLSRVRPDACIVATMSLMKDVREAFLVVPATA